MAGGTNLPIGGEECLHSLVDPSCLSVPRDRKSTISYGAICFIASKRLYSIIIVHTREIVH